MSKSFRLVFLAAILGLARTVNAATSGTVSVKLDDIPVGKVIQVGQMKFVKVGSDQYLAINSPCGDHTSLNTSATCTCESGYYSKAMTTTANLYESCYACPSGWTYNSSYGGCYKDFAYTGSIQNFTTVYAGKYKLEVWGAQGGNSKYEFSRTGGYGGYSYGTVTLSKNKQLYIVVGDQGQNVISSTQNGTGYNGGGLATIYRTGVTGCNAAGGGGATHIAEVSGLLSTLSSTTNRAKVYIVAGGGGGALSNHNNTTNGEWSGNGGSGGGYQGNSGECGDNVCHYYGTGGTQTATGSQITVIATSSYNNYTTPAKFGFGQNTLANYSDNYWSGGGGGFYGGASGLFAGAGGGSGYINTSLLTNYGMKQYSATNTTYTTSVSCANANHDGNCANTGAGYARVTLTSID